MVDLGIPHEHGVRTMSENGGVKNSDDTRRETPVVPSVVYHMCRILLGLIFVIASLEKIERPWDFGRAVQVYELMIGPLGYFISPLVIVMPTLELVAGLFLIINRWVRPSALIILAMNVLFIFVILSAMARGMDIDCGCGLDTGLVAILAGTQADAGALVRDFIFVGCVFGWG